MCGCVMKRMVLLGYACAHVRAAAFLQHHCIIIIIIIIIIINLSLLLLPVWIITVRRWTLAAQERLIFH